MDNSQSKQTILLVDDAAVNIDVLTNILSPLYKIKAATTGERALKVAFTNPPDLILLDVIMPEMDGYEVCRRLKDDPRTKNIPVIFVTAKDDTEHESFGFELGAVDYITKPVNAVIVKARVQTHVALSNQNKELERKVQDRTQQLIASRREIIERLGRAAEFKDGENGMHIVRMSHYCYALAEAIAMSIEEADILLHAAPMHDIGKIGIPDNVLLKEGKLDNDEWDLMRKHTTYGAEILGSKNLPGELLDMAYTVALTHHEKFNGTGYPDGLKGEEIPLVGRIVAIADVFDALTTPRPYKEAWSVEKAIELIKSESGQHFDPMLVDKFIEILPEILRIKEKYDDPSNKAE